jgi:hypothetical protein
MLINLNRHMQLKCACYHLCYCATACNNMQLFVVHPVLCSSSRCNVRCILLRMQYTVSLQVVGKIGSFFAPGGGAGAQRKSSLESATLFAE